MEQDTVLVELRFGSDARASYDTAVAVLASLDVDAPEIARDPTIVVALTVAASAVTLASELVKLVKELRAKGQHQNITIAIIDIQNTETTANLLVLSEKEIERFVSSK